MKTNYVTPSLKLLELHPRAAVLANTSWGSGPVRGGGTYEEEDINDNGEFNFINY
ncbi:MAG: hypothetical protein J5871_04800 [Bacteroidales bacterium]|nr:hypothetical protein [Bacteroidales bacterium]